jgi:hypothetical protein
MLASARQRREQTRAGYPSGCGTPIKRLQRGLELRAAVTRGLSTVLAGGGRLLASARRRARAARRVGEPRLPIVVRPAHVTCPPHTFTAWVRRRADLLDLRFEFYNLALVTSGPHAPKLVRANKGIQISRIVVVFPPQHVTDEAFMETAAITNDPPISNQPPPAPGTAQARVAGETRLAFEVDDVEIPFDLTTLLNWAPFAQAVVEVAQTSADEHRGPVPRPTPVKHESPVRPLPRPELRKPLECETQIELPWRLLLSPSERGAWAHAAAPVTHNDRTELWHTRLGVRGPHNSVDEHDDTGRTLRAVWALDQEFPHKPSAPEPFLMSLRAIDRYEIVRATSDYTISGVAPVAARRLTLSALGGWLDSRGAWRLPDAAGFSLEEWRHIAAQGRDAYVRVVHAGYLFPFGHRASVIAIAERKFDDAASQRVAVLRKRYFLLVRMPVKDYGKDGSLGMPDEGRDFCFTRVRITTLVTPNLEKPTSFLPPHGDEEIFVPTIGGHPFLFHMIGTDWANAEAEFTSPVVFVIKDLARNASAIQALAAKYNDNSATPIDDKQAFFSGQTVAIAPPNTPGDTSVELSEVRWGADTVGTPPPAPAPYEAQDQPFFWPNFGEADVRIGPAEQAAGASPASKPTIHLDPDYVLSGFGPGQVFAKLKDPSPLQFGADHSGGVATPNFGISGLSRHLGPVGGKLETVKSGLFRPEDFFQGALPKLLGGVDLAAVVNNTSVAPATPPKEAPLLTYRTEGNILRTHLAWTPSLKTDEPLHVFQPSNSNGPASMTLDVDLVTDVTHPADSTYAVDGDLRNFTLSLVGDSAATQFLVLTFNRLHFTAKKGQKSHVEVDLVEVRFAGVLKFVQQLQDVMAIGSGDKTPAIDVDAQGIAAHTALPIPDLAVGVFALTNLKFSASLNIPFSGKPVRVRFAFSDRADTFLLQIAMFAGGGFFAIAVGGDGVEQVEAALEFGASVSIDIGVASGGVHLIAGIYFSYGVDPDSKVETTVLTGYVRLGGELSVLGIVSMSLEFYMDLSYVSVDGHDKSAGTATLSVEVDVLMFSETVSCTVKKQFGEGDPSFHDQLPSPSLWEEYCEAFATVP